MVGTAWCLSACLVHDEQLFACARTECGAVIALLWLVMSVLLIALGRSGGSWTSRVALPKSVRRPCGRKCSMCFLRDAFEGGCDISPLEPHCAVS